MAITSLRTGMCPNECNAADRVEFLIAEGGFEIVVELFDWCQSCQGHVVAIFPELFQ